MSTPVTARLRQAKAKRAAKIIAPHAVVDFLAECMPHLDDRALLEIADMVGYEQARRHVVAPIAAPIAAVPAPVLPS